MIGVPEDHSALQQTVLFQFFENLAHLFIHGNYIGINLPHVSLGHSGIRQVWRNRHLKIFRHSKRIFGLHPNLALVGYVEIKDRKKRLIRPSVTPVCGSAAVIPGRNRLAKLIILLGIIARVITGFPEILAMHFDERRRHGFIRNQTINTKPGHVCRSHVLRTNSVLVHARRQSSPARRTDSGSRKYAGVANAFRCKPVEIRRRHRVVFERRYNRTEIFRNQPQDIRPIRKDRLIG